ncbi:LysR family transcriptional regulator [Solimonas soli]|uniref:LysR family transcriptional regulator n=1 Tax=Solimonas soli TaxID=413479 RepID=UPI0004822F79|nr:LysR family transcriptional regulator [Solimonas soli]
MDNRSGEIEVFLRVVDGGSFAAAAKMLRVTPSAVSRTIARLEARLGVRLLQRTTRSLTLTAEGEAFRVRAQAIAAEIDDLERSFSTAKVEPRGRLRVTASLPFGLHCLLPVLPEFLERHPQVSVDLSLTDALVDLVDQRMDVAIRHGPLRDSNLRARSLGASRWIVAASPAYLKRHGRPKTPADLDRHNCLNFNFRRALEGWNLRATAGANGAPRRQAVNGNFQGNSGESLRVMAVAGAGIVRLAHFLIGADLAAGRLVPLLENYNPGDREEIHALYLGHDKPAARVRAFVDFLVERATVTD